MSECLTINCHNASQPGQLCNDCQLYFSKHIGFHPTFIRPKVELVPTLNAIFVMLNNARNPIMRNAGLKGLELLISELNRKL